MTAPAAPTIRVRTSGTVVYVRWQAVLNATDYKLYVGSTTAPAGVEDDIEDDDIGDDGWFQYAFDADDVDTYVALTALNVLAEESGPSNEVHMSLRNASH